MPRKQKVPHCTPLFPGRNHSQCTDPMRTRRGQNGLSTTPLNVASLYRFGRHLPLLSMSRDHNEPSTSCAEMFLLYNVMAWLVPLKEKKKKTHIRRHGATPSLSLQEEEASSHNTTVKTAKSATKRVLVSKIITKVSEAAAEEKTLPLKNPQMCSLLLPSAPPPTRLSDCRSGCSSQQLRTHACHFCCHVSCCGGNG